MADACSQMCGSSSHPTTAMSSGTDTPRANASDTMRSAAMSFAAKSPHGLGSDSSQSPMSPLRYRSTCRPRLSISAAKLLKRVSTHGLPETVAKKAKLSSPSDRSSPAASNPVGWESWATAAVPRTWRGALMVTVGLRQVAKSPFSPLGGAQ